MSNSKSIPTNKLFASIRQIQAAIYHFKNDDYECAITLAAAAEGILPNVEALHLFALVRTSPAFKDLDPNLAINWLKHSTGSYELEISEFEAVITIIRSISKLIAVEKTLKSKMAIPFPDDIKMFARWAFEQGHLPMPDNWDA